MALEILKPGLSTTVQDLGRPGYYHLGIPESGAMDKFSLAAANLLVGNPEGAAALEAVFQGPEIRFDRDAVVAVCGAHMAPKVDGADAAQLDVVCGEVGPDAVVRLPQIGRARLYRRLRRRRRAPRAGLALHLSARRAGRLRGPRPESRRSRECGSPIRAREARPERARQTALRDTAERPNCGCSPASTGIV